MKPIVRAWCWSTVTAGARCTSLSTLRLAASMIIPVALYFKNSVAKSVFAKSAEDTGSRSGGASSASNAAANERALRGSTSAYQGEFISSTSGEKMK